MPGCSAVGCSNRTEQGFVMKVFPKDPQRRSLWEARVNRLNWIPNSHSYLCEVHFEASQFKEPGPDGKKKLKIDAVPTLFSHIKTGVKRKSPMKRNPLPKKRIHHDPSIENPTEESKEQIINCLTEQLRKANCNVAKLKKENKVLKQSLRRKTLQFSKYKSSWMGKKIFNDDQIKALTVKSMAYRKWSNKTVQTALGLRFSCGTSGYETLLSLNLPFPSVRTLQRRVENLKFQSGILHEVINFLRIKVSAFKNENEKEAVLLIDEMAITPGVDYDTSTCSYIGEATFPKCEGKAKDALVFMVGGISSRWKQTVAYYFTNNQADGSLLKGVILEVIKEVEKVGLRINSITSDMCGVNQAMWKAFKIGYSSKTSNCCIAHPQDPKRLIYFFADPPHLLKNIRTSLLTNSHIIIPTNFQIKHQLSSSIVTSEHLNVLMDHQRHSDLKLAPKITDDHLNLKHFNKMKVGMAHNVLSHPVSCALEFLSEEIDDSSLKTTAWFIAQVSRWFDIMSSRNPVNALSKFKPAVYDETVAFLTDIIDLYANMKVVQKNNKTVWKPIQTGVLLSTTSILKLHEHLLNQKKFHFVMVSRFSQDSLENLFNVVRSKQSVPTAVEFKNNLKLISIAQYMKKSTTGSYDLDDRELLSGFLDTLTSPSPPKTTHQIILPTEWDLTATEPLSAIERNCLFSIAGYIVYSLSKLKVCNNCIDSLGSKVATGTQDSKLVELKEYKKNCLYFVRDEVFQMFICMEQLFRSLEERLLKMSDCRSFLKGMFENLDGVKSLILPECHDVKNKLLNRYASFRLKIFGMKNKRTNSVKVDESDVFKSKSIAMHALADRV